MRRIKNLLSLLIIITFIFNFVSLCNYSVYANVVDSRDKNDINEIIENFENPLYEGLNVKEYSPKDNINSKLVSVFNSLEEAAIFVRDEMVNRKGNISFILPKELYHSGILKELVELATEDYDNGKSSEGDYLNKHYGGCSAKIKSYSDGQYQYDINMRYLSTYEQEEQVDKAIDEVLDNLDIKGKDDYTKIKLIHDYIVENIRYDYTYSKYSAYNAIIDKSVVCQGFSTLTYKMFKEAGLKVRYISGIGNGGRHGWNIVKLGDKWYNIDNTWDSCYSESGPLSYEWFLKDKYNFPDHTRDSEYNTSEFNEKYPMATVPYNYTSSISITLNKTSLTLLEGESEKLKATINPSNATDKTVTWESSNSSVAIVDSNGNVVAIGKGEAYITANINGENVQAECKVIVKENQVKVTDIKLNKTSLTLLEGESEQLEATINPSDATDKTVTWKSSDESVATVDETGKVIAVSEGTAIITVKTKDGDKVATCKLTVKKPLTLVTENKLIGEDRYKTAIKVSNEGWSKSENIVLVNSSAIVDALSATPFAKLKDAPILLTGSDQLNNETQKEIIRLGAKNIYVIGGTGVVSENIISQLKSMNLNVDRISGDDRYTTSLEIAKRLGNVSEIAVVNGVTGLADAVSIAPVAADRNMPIVLSSPNEGTKVFAEFIKTNNIKTSYVIGGESAISKDVASKLPNVNRLGGLSRNKTNAIILDKFYTNNDLNNIFVAKNGMKKADDLIDALAVGVLASKENSPVVIVGNKLDTKQEEVLKSKTPKEVTQVGGNGNENAFSQIVNMFKK